MLYYDVPEAYDLFFNDSYTEQTRSFFEKLFVGHTMRGVLDCTCGTGQMSLPLARMGLHVTASDINLHMLKKARQNFAAQELMATFQRADILELDKTVRGTFDAVLATGNSLAHVQPDALETALRQMDSVLKPGGLLYFDSLNWELILERQQRFYLFNPLIRDKGRVNYIQVWDYNRDDSMTFNFLIFEEIGDKIVSKRQFYVIYYPFQRDTVTVLLEGMGYTDINVCRLGDADQHDISEANWYALTAVKPLSEELEPVHKAPMRPRATKR
ncbi:MAG: class I SAM-dependent methyltransferase [Candidatus Cloacimonetes bacterium]|nr:class I SAM-dependent methyltransferase [Candidatus Cloacimonadota bacterium]